MKLKKLLILSLLLIPCLFIGCAKKDKLTNNTMVLSIEPHSNITMAKEASRSLTAVIRNSKLEDIDEPVTWSVSPNLGTFSSQSKNTEFTAASTGNGTITVTCQGMQASIEVSVS